MMKRFSQQKGRERYTKKGGGREREREEGGEVVREREREKTEGTNTN